MVTVLLALCASAFVVNRLTILSQLGKGGAFVKKAPPESVEEPVVRPLPKSHSPMRRVFEPEKLHQAE